MLYTFIRNSGNRKTGPLPVTYNLRETCPPGCALYRAGCYGEDFHTRMSWDKVPQRGARCSSWPATFRAYRPAKCGVLL